MYTQKRLRENINKDNHNNNNINRNRYIYYMLYKNDRK